MTPPPYTAHVSSLPACCMVSPPSPDDWGKAVGGMFSFHGFRESKRRSLCPPFPVGTPPSREGDLGVMHLLSSPSWLG